MECKVLDSEITERGDDMRCIAVEGIVRQVAQCFCQSVAGFPRRQSREAGTQRNIHEDIVLSDEELCQRVADGGFIHLLQRRQHKAGDRHDRG